jgi:hypothetical protein
MGLNKGCQGRATPKRESPEGDGTLRWIVQNEANLWRQGSGARGRGSGTDVRGQMAEMVGGEELCETKPIGMQMLLA